MSLKDKKNNQRLNDAIIEAQRLHLEYAFYERVNFRNRRVLLTEDIEEDSFTFIDAALTELETNNDDPITIVINSFGGSYYEALAIVGRIRKSNCEIITEGYGKMMSAAFLILACGHKRKVNQFAWGMFHTISMGQHHSPAHYVESEAKHLMTEVNQMCEILAKFTKKPKRFWRGLAKKPDTYMSPDKLLQLGVVDEIF